MTNREAGRGPCRLPVLPLIQQDGNGNGSQGKSDGGDVTVSSGQIKNGIKKVDITPRYTSPSINRVTVGPGRGLINRRCNTVNVDTGRGIVVVVVGVREK